MSDVAYIELPSSKTRGHVCEVLGNNTSPSSNCFQHGDRTASDAPCVQPKPSFVWPWLQHSACTCNASDTSQSKIAETTLKKYVLDMVNMRLLAGTRVNSRHLATLHGCLLNYQLKRPCSACGCNQVGFSDNDMSC